MEKVKKTGRRLSDAMTGSELHGCPWPAVVAGARLLACVVVVAALLTTMVTAQGGRSDNMSDVADSRLPTITTVGAAHRLSYEEAARAYPVKVQAVITYYDPYLNHPRRPVIMVTDQTGSIYVGLPGETTMPLKAGLLVEVEGVSNPGDFGPNISHAKLRILGPAALPPHPQRQSMAHLLTGSEDAQWIELEAVVKSVQTSGGNVALKLALADGEMSGTTVKEQGADYERLIDSKVLIRGIAGTLFNKRGQTFGLQLLFPGRSAIQVEEAGAANPYELPLTPIKNLMTYVPGKVFVRLVHLRGTVTLFWPGRMLCIQDRSDAICADTAETAEIAVGERADLIGFPMIGNVTPTMSDTRYRKTGGLQSVFPTSIDLDQAMSAHYDSQLVSIEGTLIAHDRASDDPAIVVSASNSTYSVILPKGMDGRKLQQLEEGSRLRMTGICSVQADPRVLVRHDGYPIAKRFQVMLRSADDIRVVQRPSWWTTKHTLAVLASGLAVTLGILCWTIYLGVQVKRQTELLRYQATHDELTGLWNRKAVLDMMRREFELAARANKQIGVMMLDVDHFKRVNDTHGHLVGDAVLKELAKRIQQSIRSSDLTGRYGGEEFLIVLPGCMWEEAWMCAERVRAAIADRPIKADGVVLAVTISVGTAVLDPLVNDERNALATADQALYKAKNSGRNRVVAGELMTEVSVR